jgi:hypothetical protein
MSNEGELIVLFKSPNELAEEYREINLKFMLTWGDIKRDLEVCRAARGCDAWSIQKLAADKVDLADSNEHIGRRMTVALNAHAAALQQHRKLVKRSERFRRQLSGTR